MDGLTTHRRASTGDTGDTWGVMLGWWAAARPVVVLAMACVAAGAGGRESELS